MKSFIEKVNSIIANHGGKVRVTVLMKELYEHGTTAQFAETLRGKGYDVERYKADHNALTVLGIVDVLESEPVPEPVTEPVQEPKPAISDKLASEIERAYNLLQNDCVYTRQSEYSKYKILEYSVDSASISAGFHKALDWLECAGITCKSRIFSDVRVSDYRGHFSSEHNVRVWTMAPEYRCFKWQEMLDGQSVNDKLVALSRRRIFVQVKGKLHEFFERFGTGDRAQIGDFMKASAILLSPLCAGREIPSDILDDCLLELQPDFIVTDGDGFRLDDEVLQTILAIAADKLKRDPDAVIADWIRKLLDKPDPDPDKGPGKQADASPELDDAATDTATVPMLDAAPSGVCTDTTVARSLSQKGCRARSPPHMLRARQWSF